MIEPSIKRTIAFVGGQDLYHAAKEAFGYPYPNYNVKALCERICSVQGWDLREIYFYTGIPDIQDNSFWHNFWSKKLSYMGRQGIKIFARDLRYHNEDMKCPSCGKTYTKLTGHEKGVDVRIAIDIVRFARENTYDVALVFSQDQDLSEVAEEMVRIASQQDRWIKIASAYPASPTYRNYKGINKTDWIKIDKAAYDFCIDPTDYRPKSTP